MRFENIKNIEKKASPLDLILLELPASASACSGVSHSGLDYAVGFYEGVRRTKDGKCVVLSSCQKRAYDIEEKEEIYPFEDISAFEIIRKYEPQIGDGIDEMIADLLGYTYDEDRNKYVKEK